MTQAKTKTVNNGLEGVIAGDTKICFLDDNHDGLFYYGYNISDLCQQANFEIVAFLLIYGRLPERQELAIFCDDLIKGQNLPEVICKLLENLPVTSHPMDILRTVCSMLIQGIFISWI